MLLLSSEYSPPPRPLYALLSLSRSGPGCPLQFLLSHATIGELSGIPRWSPCHATNRSGQDILTGSPSPRPLEDEWTSISRHLTTKQSHVAYARSATSSLLRVSRFW